MRLSIPLSLFALVLVVAGCDSKTKVSRDRDDDADEERPKKKAKDDKPAGSAGPSSDTSAATGSPVGQAQNREVPVAGGGPTFTLKTAKFKPKDTIELAFDRPLIAPAGQQYWVTLVGADQPDTTFGAWHYLKSGVTSGTLVADQPGDYEVRFYDLHPQTKYKVLTRQRVSVVECAQASDCPGAGPLCENGKCVGAGSSPVPIEEASPNDYAADGWPQVLAPPGSKAPTTEEWAAVPREVTVRGSSGLKCETKVVREWLRVSCRANSLGVPVTVTHAPAYGQQAFTFVSPGSVTSAVLQLIPGKAYSADFSWGSPDLGTSTFTMTLRWINGRPNAAFNTPGAM